jgi:hypothetical protein
MTRCGDGDRSSSGKGEAIWNVSFAERSDVHFQYPPIPRFVSSVVLAVLTMTAAVKNPTNPNPDSNSHAPSSASSVVEQQTGGLIPPTSTTTPTPGIMTPGTNTGAGFNTPGPVGLFEAPVAPNIPEWGNDVFDPLSWVLDGMVDFPYNVFPEDAAL